MSRTLRCAGDCQCEQKYKWHRLLAYDPNNDCEGVFMDWFLFPSCCSCRCELNLTIIMTTFQSLTRSVFSAAFEILCSETTKDSDECAKREVV